MTELRQQKIGNISCCNIRATNIRVAKCKMKIETIINKLTKGICYQSLLCKWDILTFRSSFDFTSCCWKVTEREN